MAKQRCGYGTVFGECGERNAVRVAHHIVSEDGGKTTQVICSNCLGHFFCSEENDIDTFGHFNPITFDFSIDTVLDQFVLVEFNKEEWAKNLERRSKRGFY